MRILSNCITYSAAISIGLFSASILTANTFVRLSDEFTDPPNALNTDIWTKSGVYTPVHIVSGGRLTMRSAGWAHHATITSVDDGFNFFESRHSVSAKLSGFPAPNWESDPVNLSGVRDLFFVLGPASSWDHYVDWNNQYYKWDGFGFALRWQTTSVEEPRAGRLEIFSPNEATGIGTREISNVPSGIDYSVDADAFTIELTGATFVDSGSSTLIGTHSLDDSSWNNRYYLMVVLHQSALNANALSEVVIDSILVSSDSPPAGPTSWAGYPIMENGWVDTGGWLGYLNVGPAPWIYSVLLQRWIYLPEENVSSYGAWLYAPM